MSQSYPWFKFAHVEYLLDPMITSLSLAAQGANTRLMAYAARQMPFGTLPNDDKTLIAMSGAKSAKQWQKIYAELMGVVWFLGDDGRLHCPMMIVESTPQAKQDDNQDNDRPLTDAERAKRYRDRKNSRDENNQASRDHHDSVTKESDDRHEANVTQRDDSVTFWGIKGGDLDLNLEKDLDINQYINSHSKTREAEKKSSRFFDDELRPDVNALNAKLGANLITQKFIDENLFSFNANYETQQLTENQRLAKWIAWFRGEQSRHQSKNIQRPSKTQPPKNQKPVFGNVNESFPLNPNDRPLTAAEKAEIAKMLEEDENVVF